MPDSPCTWQRQSAVTNEAGRKRARTKAVVTEASGPAKPLILREQGKGTETADIDENSAHQILCLSRPRLHFGWSLFRTGLVQS